MVANLTIGRKKYADIEPEAIDIVGRANILRNELTLAVKADSEAFEEVMKAYRDISPDKKKRDAAIEKAMVVAGEIPLSVARRSLEVASLALEISRIGNINALTDAVAGGIMARAAVQIASLNVRVNATSLENQELGSQWLEELERIEKSADALSKEIMAIAEGRGGF
jgi:formiminotetrahydrofolate cyclodeaminase